MSQCRHSHPFPEHCAQCKDEAARWSAQKDERQRIMDLINNRLTESHSRDVRMALLRLRDDLLTSATPIAASLRGQPTRQPLG